MDEDLLIVGHWWSFLARGLIAIILGIILIAMPGITGTTVIVLVGLLVLLEGLVNVVLAITRGIKGYSWGWTLAWGLISILIGGLILSRPSTALTVVIILAGLWAIVVGIIMLAFSFDLPPDTGRGFVGILGFLSIVMGIIILAYPAGSAYAVAVLVGIYALIRGVYEIILAVMARALQRRIEKGEPVG